MATSSSSSTTQQQKPLLLIIITFLLGIVANNPRLIFLTLAAKTAGTSFDLIHVDRLAGRQHLTQAERMEQMLQRDMIRMATIQRAAGPTVIRRQTTEEFKTAVMPMSPGMGEYFTELKVGTPPQTFSVIPDTGSELIWVDCNKSLPVFFDKAKSTSFENVTCSSKTCKELGNVTSFPEDCFNPNDHCVYNYSYVKGSVVGDYAMETLTFGLTDRTNHTQGQMLIGCTNTRYGLDSLFGGSELSGVMGLDNGFYSILTQTESLFQRKFSYCLVDFQSRETELGKLYLGSPPPVPPSDEVLMQSTNLTFHIAGPFHGVFVKSISIDGHNLTDIPPAAWDFNGIVNGGTILDSGTTVTRLLDSAYGPVVDALNKALSSQYVPARGSLLNCYKKRDNSSEAVALPEMVIHFVGGAKWVVPKKNYFFDDTYFDGVKCLALDKVGGDEKAGYNVIGNMWQQSHLWMFDVENADLKFGPSTCT